MAKKSDTKSKNRENGGSNAINSGGAKGETLFRVRVLYILFILIGFGIATRLVWVQMFSSSVEHNAKVLKEGIVRKVVIPAHRGAILTREGDPLAMSSLRYEPTFDFKSEGFNDTSEQSFEANVDSLSRMLANHFNPQDAKQEGYKYISAAEYKDIFHRERSRGKERAFKIFPRPVTLDEWEMMTSEFPILNNNMGVVYGVERVDKRIHPMGEMAHQFIGSIYNRGVDENGQEKIDVSGIESIYDDYLSGSNGRATEQYIAHGFWSRMNDDYNKEPEDGCDVVTTIDGALQRRATEILRQELEQHNGSFGVAMVMEVETGDMLCMVNLSSGPKRGTNYSEKIYNHALKTGLCPGSTFKLAAAMVLVEKCGFDLETSIQIPDKIKKVGTRIVRDSHTITYENSKPKVNISLKDGFAHSSNIYFAEAVYENFADNPKQYWEYLNELGFNSTVGLDEYDEASAKVPDPTGKEWKSMHGKITKSLPYLGYGYIVTMPPIHTLTFFNGVANGGRMVAPRLVDRIERDGTTVESMPTEVLIEKMCSQNTLDILYECLEAAATPERTKRRFAKLPFKIGCKTGTAEIQAKFIASAEEDIRNNNRGITHDMGYHLGSVVCMMPLEKPKYTIMVAMLKQKTSSTDTRYGIDIAAPAASDIMLYLYNNDPSLHPEVAEAPSPYTPVSIKGGASDAVRRVSNEFATYIGSDNDGSVWSNTSIKAGNVEIESVEIFDGLVPDVRNMGLSDAIFLLESYGMRVTHEGVGRIVEQSVEPGLAIDETRRDIHLKLEV